MRFAEPIWLLLGLGACLVLVLLYRWADRRRRATLARFASSHLLEKLTASVSTGRRLLKRGLVVAGVACLFVALARPQAGFRWEEARRQGVDILFAVDTSKSMLAQDMKPDRLTRAKLAVSDLLARLEGDRVGLVAFAGEAFLQCPLTLDYDVFHEALSALDTSIIPRGGTDIASAVREAQAALKTESQNHKILVLITDGEDLEGEALAAAQDAAKDGLKIFTVGVGGSRGELIPVAAEGGGTQFLKDQNGNLVKSRLDEPMLRQIAEVTGGMYQPLGQQGEGLVAIYKQGLSSLPKQQMSARMQKVYFEQFQWPLGLGLILLLLEPLIGDRRGRAAVHRAQRRLMRPAAAALLLLVPVLAHASPQSAERAYQRGDYTQAQKDYEKAAAQAPSRPEYHFNLGAAAYKSGAYDQAMAAFDKTLHGQRLDLQQQAYYNLGNTQYRIGQKTEKSDVQKTIQTWQQAIQSYEAALKLKPDDADAKYNLEYVKKKLEQKQQQQQQKNQQQKQDQQKQQDQKQQKQQDQKQDQQKQDQQQQQKQDQQQQQKDQQQQGQQREQKPEQQQGQQQKDQEHGEEKERPVAGEMTKEEAKALLDSLKNEGRKVPVAPAVRSQGKRQEREPTKDW